LEEARVVVVMMGIKVVGRSKEKKVVFVLYD